MNTTNLKHIAIIGYFSYIIPTKSEFAKFYCHELNSYILKHAYACYKYIALTYVDDTIFFEKLHWDVTSINCQSYCSSCKKLKSTRNNRNYYLLGRLVAVLIARFMGPTWDPSGTDRARVGPMMPPPRTLLSGSVLFIASFQAIHISYNNFIQTVVSA